MTLKKLGTFAVLLGVMVGLAVVSKRPPAPEPPVRPPVVGGWKVPSPPSAMTRRQAVDAITAGACKESVYALCNAEWEGRMTGHAGNVKARDWIEGKFRSFGLKTQLQQFPWTPGVNPGPKGEQGDAFSSNVIGTLAGQSDRYIIVGAHFDHLGYGPRASRWGEGKIHPGADDNATGTTLVLEVAQAIHRMDYKPKHLLMFIAFSGEEMGLVGSKYYCEHPVVPLDKLDFMVNTDMIGRLNGRTSLGIGGTSKVSPFMENLNRSQSFKMSVTGSPSGGSDHAPFVGKGVSACSFHTGTHEDYHTPNDTPDRIDYEGMEKIMRYVAELVLDMDRS